MMQKIGKYQLISELGKGATSAVFLAMDSFANRKVAIKVVQRDVLGDREHGKRFRKLFLTEASLSGKLSHPHIAAIYDAVADEEGSYIVMEYVEGARSSSTPRSTISCRSTRSSRSSSSAARRWTTPTGTA
jgi:serine/threonine protein kinase